MAVDWSAVADAAAAVAAAVAAGIALHIANRDRRDRADLLKRRQAELVTAWGLREEREGEPPNYSLVFSNQSDEPVAAVTVEYVLHTRDERGNALKALEAGAEATWPLSLVPPRTTKSVKLSPEHALLIDPDDPWGNVLLTFTDTGTRRWQRDGLSLTLVRDPKAGRRRSQRGR